MILLQRSGIRLMDFCLLKANDDAHDHEADRAEFEGTRYKLKSDKERL